ncbi:MAG: PHP domain-containing protein [Ktedonobacteraceae bacterium]|nr:PHP domain-containing protein [Ktedonobacteraceae bacterium]
MFNIVDLHTHSNASDGLYAPSELLQQAKAAGLRVLALTDHDTTDGIAEAQRAAHALSIELIAGIEINTYLNEKEVHILGYFIEYEQEEFQNTLQTLRDARERRGERMVEKLNGIGLRITWERVRELAHGAVGRPHVARALMEAGYVQSVGEAFDKYIGAGRPAYVPRYRLSPADAIRLIASVRGLPVLAHPLDYPGLDLLRQVLPDLCKAGLVGLEVYYGPYTPEQEQALLVLAGQYQLIPTGGSDFHGPGIHPTPLGGHHVPLEVVQRLQAAHARQRDASPPAFQLPAPVAEQ